VVGTVPWVYRSLAGQPFGLALSPPRDIQEQARWGRLLNDPDWGAPPPATASAKVIPCINITDDYERSIAWLAVRHRLAAVALVLRRIGRSVLTKAASSLFARKRDWDSFLLLSTSVAP
jgi:hypothetical protein